MGKQFFKQALRNRQSGLSLVEVIVAVGIMGIVVVAANKGLTSVLKAKNMINLNDASTIYKDVFRGVALKTVTDVFEGDPCLTSNSLKGYLKSNAILANYRNSNGGGSRLALVDYQAPVGEAFTSAANANGSWTPARNRCSTDSSSTYSCLSLQEQSLSGTKIKNVGFVESRYMLIDVQHNTRDFRFGNSGSGGQGPGIETVPSNTDCFDAKTQLGVSAQVAYVVYTTSSQGGELNYSQQGGVASYLANDKVSENLTIEVPPSGNQSPYAFCGWRCTMQPIEPMPVADMAKKILDSEPYKKDAQGNILTQSVTTTVTDEFGVESTVTTEEPIPNPTYNTMITNVNYGKLVDGMNTTYLAFHAIYNTPSKIPYKVASKRWTRTSAPCNGSGTYNDPVCPKYPIGGEGDWACPSGYGVYSCNGATGAGCNLSSPGDCRRPDTAR